MLSLLYIQHYIPWHEGVRPLERCGGDYGNNIIVMIVYSSRIINPLVTYSYMSKCWSKITLNYHVIVERYPFMNEVVGSLIHVVQSSLYLTKRTK